MADIVSPEKRSQMMSGIRGKNTKPELLIRKKLHAKGFRYKIHVKDLPGKPDLVFPKYNAILFIHGCFWHGHDCHLFKWPSTREQFWRDKIGKTREKDQNNEKLLANKKWKVLTIWECALRGKSRLNIEDVIIQITGWLKTGKENLIIKGVQK